MQDEAEGSEYADGVVPYSEAYEPTDNEVLRNFYKLSHLSFIRTGSTR